MSEDADLLNRISNLEEELDKLTDVVKEISDRLIKLSELCPNKSENVRINVHQNLKFEW